MKFQHNPYYSPEECGLKLVDSVDTAGSYEFDIFAIWIKLDDFSIWWDTDSGCSCPVPFEIGSHDLKEVTEDTFYNFELGLKNHRNFKPEDYFRLLKTVKNYLEL